MVRNGAEDVDGGKRGQGPGGSMRRKSCVWKEKVGWVRIWRSNCPNTTKGVYRSEYVSVFRMLLRHVRPKIYAQNCKIIPSRLEWATARMKLLLLLRWVLRGRQMRGSSGPRKSKDISPCCCCMSVPFSKPFKVQDRQTWEPAEQLVVGLAT